MNRRDFLASGAGAASLALTSAPAATAGSDFSPWGVKELRRLGVWDVHAHVGLRCNVVNKTRAQFMRRFKIDLDRKRDGYKRELEKQEVK